MGITSNQMYRMSLKEKIRFCLWRMLGIDYTHIMRVVDDVYLKEDVYTTIGSHSYNDIVIDIYYFMFFLKKHEGK